MSKYNFYIIIFALNVIFSQSWLDLTKEGDEQNKAKKPNRKIQYTIVQITIKTDKKENVQCGKI